MCSMKIGTSRTPSFASDDCLSDSSFNGPLSRQQRRRKLSRVALDKIIVAQSQRDGRGPVMVASLVLRGRRGRRGILEDWQSGVGRICQPYEVNRVSVNASLFEG